MYSENPCRDKIRAALPACLPGFMLPEGLEVSIYDDLPNERAKDPIQHGVSSLKWLIIATPNRERVLRATRCTSLAGGARIC
jgi:hypothetical protein